METVMIKWIERENTQCFTLKRRGAIVNLRDKYV